MLTLGHVCTSKASMPTQQRRVYMNPPTQCNCCGDKLYEEFVDGATKYGPWMVMCVSCFQAVGIGIGVGKGQHYVKEGNLFVKREKSSVVHTMNGMVLKVGKT